MIKKLIAATAFALSLALSGAASADTLNFANTPNGSDTFTGTSIAFVNPGSVGPVAGVWAGLACSNCLTMNDFNSGTGTPFTVLSINTGVHQATVDLSSFSFTGDSFLLHINGSGTASIDGGALIPIVFSLTTQTTVAGDPTSYSGTVSTVPLPGAALLFGSGLAGLLTLGRKRKKQKLSEALA